MGVISGDQLTGSVAGAQATADDGKRVRVLAVMPVRPDGSLIDPAGGGGGNGTTNGLTDAQLRASPVPVAGPLTDAQLRATAVSVTFSNALPAGTNAIGTVTAVGNVAAGATDSGNPLKTGGVYNTTLPTYTAGQRGETQLDARGGTYVVLKSASGVSFADINPAQSDGVAPTSSLAARSFNVVFNGTTWDRQRGDVAGTWVNQRPTAGTDLSGTATTTSGVFNIPADAARHPGDIQGQNVSAVNIGVNEFGGTAAIGSPGTYTVPPGGSFSISTNRLVNFVSASGSAAVTITKL